MKKWLFLSIYSVLLMTYANAQDIWVSDEIKAPLRKTPELNATIIALIASGQRVTEIDKNDNYVKIKTANGDEGWLSNYYVLNQKSVHDKYASLEVSSSNAKKSIADLSNELETKNQQITQLTSTFDNMKKTVGETSERAKNSESGVTKLSADNEILQKKLKEQNEKMSQLATVLNVANKKASDASTRYLSLVKVSENVFDIDKQNRSLQEKAVQFEQDLQQLKTENQSLKSQIGKKEFIIGALTILGGILIGYILSVMMPPRGRRRRNYSL
ncbi:MAG: TIGR04211 family SH3 domain-containing protein [Ostreibacterium sp.]